MTNDTFLNDHDYYNDHDDYDDPNDGLDDLQLSDQNDDDDSDEDLDDNPTRPSSPYGYGYGPYHGPYNRPYGSYTKPEPSITKDLLKALLASHAREIALLKKINRDLRNPPSNTPNTSDKSKLH